MSLVIDRAPGESFVIIDTNDPESFTLVTIHGRKVEISAPKNVHIIRREILHRYAVHESVLASIQQMEHDRDNGPR